MSDAQLAEAFHQLADSIRRLAEATNHTMRWFLVGMIVVAVVMVVTLMAILHDLREIRRQIGSPDRAVNANTVNVSRPPTDNDILQDVLNELKKVK